MPEIDKDLYQLLTLVLLGLGVLLLLAMLSSLGGIRKALKKQLERLESQPAAVTPSLDSRGDTDAGVAAAEPSVGVYEEPLSEAEPPYSATGSVATEPDSGASFTPDAAPAPSDAGDELAALASDTPADTGATAGDWQPDPERFGSQTQEAGAGSSLEDPFGSGALSSTPAADEPVGAAGAGAAVEEPEDQPFERDGKWFFRRGDEFLRYDEATGQWVDADPSEASIESSAPGAGWSAPEATGAADAGATPIADETATAEIDSVGAGEPSPQPAAGGFWKCASCGAVNGASATSCRMCFAQRP